jgi:hypothetical protein
MGVCGVREVSGEMVVVVSTSERGQTARCTQQELYPHHAASHERNKLVSSQGRGVVLEAEGWVGGWVGYVTSVHEHTRQQFTLSSLSTVATAIAYSVVVGSLHRGGSRDRG